MTNHRQTTWPQKRAGRLAASQPGDLTYTLGVLGICGPVRQQDSALGCRRAQHGPCLQRSLEICVENCGKHQRLCGSRADFHVRVMNLSDGSIKVHGAQRPERVGQGEVGFVLSRQQLGSDFGGASQGHHEQCETGCQRIIHFARNHSRPAFREILERHHWVHEVDRPLERVKEPICVLWARVGMYEASDWDVLPQILESEDGRSLFDSQPRHRIEYRPTQDRLGRGAVRFADHSIVDAVSRICRLYAGLIL
jgi:hypothetical protein